jgi:hypothetical protein
MRLAFEFLAALCAGLFSGAALYITLVEHPARMRCGAALAAIVFGPSYRRTAVMSGVSGGDGLGGGDWRLGQQFEPSLVARWQSQWALSLLSSSFFPRTRSCSIHR